MSFSGWKEFFIKDVCNKISSGGTPSRKVESYFKNGTINWVKTQELKDCKIYCTDEKITEEALNNSSAKLFPINTVSMAMYGATVGKLGILKAESSTNQACCNMVANPNVLDYRFLYYTLIHKREELIGLASGAAQQNLNVGIISNFAIKKPTLYEQKAIAATLSCLDDKIELNNRINKNLEDIVQAIFKSWFVDFEPFQDGEFEDSELGKIPKGWRVGLLGDILTLNYGKSLPAKKRIYGNVRVYSSAGITGFHNQALANEPSVIIGRKGTIGSVYYSEEPSFCIDTAYYVTQKDSKIPLLVTCQFLKNMKLEQFNEDSAVPGLNRNTVYAQDIIIPPENAINKYNEILSNIYSTILNNQMQNFMLTTIRDTLLPELMSGEIRVPIEEVQADG